MVKRGQRFRPHRILISHCNFQFTDSALYISQKIAALRPLLEVGEDLAAVEGRVVFLVRIAML